MHANPNFLSGLAPAEIDVSYWHDEPGQWLWRISVVIPVKNRVTWKYQRHCFHQADEVLPGDQE